MICFQPWFSRSLKHLWKLSRPGSLFYLNIMFITKHWGLDFNDFLMVPPPGNHCLGLRPRFLDSSPARWWVSECTHPMPRTTLASGINLPLTHPRWFWSQKGWAGICHIGLGPLDSASGGGSELQSQSIWSLRTELYTHGPALPHPASECLELRVYSKVPLSITFHRPRPDTHILIWRWGGKSVIVSAYCNQSLYILNRFSGLP